MKILPEPNTNFRLEGNIVRQDFVPPVPVGSYIACMFQVTGYDHDCDGSAMARLEQVNEDGETTGWAQDCMGLYAACEVILDEPNELHQLARKGTSPARDSINAAS